MPNDPENPEKTDRKGRTEEVRVWCDGCYDLVHFGHANSLRQAKALGDRLIVGVHADGDVARHKGPPVFTSAERRRMVEGLKWVDEVVEGAPYVTTLDVLDENGCDFCCHGDDVTVTDEGLDTYHLIKGAGRYREVQRTAGVSTTGLVKRILDRTRGGHRIDDDGDPMTPSKSPWTGSAPFLWTTEKILNFQGPDAPKLRDAKKVIYVTGAFDLFHVGHVDFLQKAQRLGDYLIVGVHSDKTVEGYKGEGYPVMTLQERVQGVLGCKYVSETVIGAPYVVTRDLMEHLRVHLVVDGNFPRIEDPFEWPKMLKKFVVIDSGSDVTTEKIVARIASNRIEYETRNRKKEQKELEIISNLEHV